MKPNQGRLEGSHTKARPNRMQKEGGIELEHKRKGKRSRKRGVTERDRGRERKELKLMKAVDSKDNTLHTDKNYE